MAVGRGGEGRGAGEGVHVLLELFRNVDKEENGPNCVDLLFSQKQRVVRNCPSVTFTASSFLKLGTEGLYWLGLRVFSDLGPVLKGSTKRRRDLGNIPPHTSAASLYLGMSILHRCPNCASWLNPSSKLAGLRCPPDFNSKVRSMCTRG